MENRLEIRVHGEPDQTTLIYLPGLHGDWTLVSRFRAQAIERYRFVEFTYPRTLCWTLEDYAREVLGALEANDVRSGWLIGESFGSQVMWEILRLVNLKPTFEFQGAVLAGGFVKYPVPGLVAIGIALFSKASTRDVQVFLKLFIAYARFRFRHSHETLVRLDEFISRRTDVDVSAMVHRMRLLNENDPRAIASEVKNVPVYQLSGFWDPIVFQPLVRHWLEIHCPGFRGSHTIFSADHTLLATEPAAAFAQIAHWIKQ